jgi:hypothetical protein
MGWVALGEGDSKIQTIDDKGVKGTPLIIEEIGVEWILKTFMSKLVITVGISRAWQVEIYVPHLLTLRFLGGGFGKGYNRGGRFKRRRDQRGGYYFSTMTKNPRCSKKS